jgi:hypothetical protein
MILHFIVFEKTKLLNYGHNWRETGLEVLTPETIFSEEFPVDVVCIQVIFTHLCRQNVKHVLTSQLKCV